MQVPPGGASDHAPLVRFLDVATQMLAAAREEIDALNVYPVPDGDTGTNMYLTLVSARDAVRDLVGQPDESGGLGPSEVTGQQAWAALARGALLGARGNSGVILSQMLGAVAQSLASADPTARGSVVLAEAFAAATTASYAAVGDPVEGTILTVAAAASRAASEAAADTAADTGVRRVASAAAAAAREALRHTPDQLPVLAEAGVVDAGGRGLVVVLDAAEHVLTGRRAVSAPASLSSHRIPVPTSAGAGTGAPTPGFEVVYLLDTDPTEEAAESEAIAALRARLATLGDSLVVVGGHGLWKVHVHVDDAGAAVEAGLVAGEPREIRITHLDGATAVRAEPRRTGRRVVAVAAGPGLERLFGEAGATVVPGGPGRRPSAGMLLEAMAAVDAAEVVVLPNDADTVAAAELAAGRLRERDEHGDRDRAQIAVIPTRSQVEGLAALAVHEPGRTFAADVLEMTATARHVRQGAVTLAARRAITMAGPCEPGDALGVVAGDFAVVGGDLAAVAREVTERLLAGGGDLVTVVSGVDGALLADGLAAHLEEQHPTVDVVVYDGGQDRYPLLLSVE